MIMKPGKPHLPPASWVPRNASGVIQSETEGLRTREAFDVHCSLRSGKDEMKCPSSVSEAGRKGQIPLPLPFVLFWSSMH